MVKEAVLAGDTVRVIVDLVSGPLAHHPRMSEQDAAIVQLVLSFVRNLLAVSDAKATEGAGGDHRSRLRGDLLAALERDHVLELLLTFATFSDTVGMLSSLCWRLRGSSVSSDVNDRGHEGHAQQKDLSGYCCNPKTNAHSDLAGGIYR